MKKHIYILLIIFFAGCGSWLPGTKKKTRTKLQITEQSKIVETGRRYEIIPADSLVFIAPPENKKDTAKVVKTIENKQLKIEATIKKGCVKKVKATQKPKVTVTDYNRTEKKEVQTNVKQAQTIKETKWKEIYIVYLFVGLALLIFVNNRTKRN